eukprot:jgi/Mesvir1/3798/Mv02824-RA.1
MAMPHADKEAMDGLSVSHWDNWEERCWESVPMYVMLPLDTVTIVNTLNHVKALNAGLRALKMIGVRGVMVDVWWGIVEADRPKHYDWSAYKALMRLIKAAGLRVQAVMSFHACGGNVGDCCQVGLPRWVLEAAEENPDVLYTDKLGMRNGEYLSLGVDNIPLFHGRTPIAIYYDFMRSFRENFADVIGDVIQEVTIGLGPAGELRYPSYPENGGRWRFPGIGEFQCYDRYMRANLRACALQAGVPAEWGVRPPKGAGNYMSRPDDTNFFRKIGGQGLGKKWSAVIASKPINDREVAEFPRSGLPEGADHFESAKGNFFLQWYAESLVAHGDRVMTAASAAFADTGLKLHAKLPGIHWWYQHPSHAAELTAGYYMTWRHNGYESVVRMLAKHKAVLNFTCAEMRDDEQPGEALCSPQELLLNVRRTAARAGVPIAGENALPRYDSLAYQHIVYNAYAFHDLSLPRMEAFTYLRMGEHLFQPANWRLFVKFADIMHHADVLYSETEGVSSVDEAEFDRTVHTLLKMEHVELSNTILGRGRREGKKWTMGGAGGSSGGASAWQDAGGNNPGGGSSGGLSGAPATVSSLRQPRSFVKTRELGGADLRA